MGIMKTVILGVIVLFSLFSTGKGCFGRCTVSTGRLVETTVTSIMHQQDDIKELEKESFIVCDTDGDEGLSWDEVEKCEDKYKLFLDVDSFDHLPNKEEFESFDTNEDGVLFYKEWEDAIDEE